MEEQQLQRIAWQWLVEAFKNEAPISLHVAALWRFCSLIFTFGLALR
jgi:hypothetical protein